MKKCKYLASLNEAQFEEFCNSVLTEHYYVQNLITNFNRESFNAFEVEKELVKINGLSCVDIYNFMNEAFEKFSNYPEFNFTNRKYYKSNWYILLTFTDGSKFKYDGNDFDSEYYYDIHFGADRHSIDKCELVLSSINYDICPCPTLEYSQDIEIDQDFSSLYDFDNSSSRMLKL